MKRTYNTLRRAIADRLTAARKKARLSQNNVAETLNIPRPSVSEIECGKRKVTAEEFVLFAKLYNVSLDWLAERENVMSQGTV
ncbi:MAG TPA: helix-turn-helix transcriptional regulator [Desulfuromonadales bacterium]|nr:helix-turn-helix transcriptional regulator [Desulfuromonadales bacterium]